MELNPAWWRQTNHWKKKPTIPTKILDFHNCDMSLSVFIITSTDEIKMLSAINRFFQYGLKDSMYVTYVDLNHGTQLLWPKPGSSKAPNYFEEKT